MKTRITTYLAAILIALSFSACNKSVQKIESPEFEGSTGTNTNNDNNNDNTGGNGISTCFDGILNNGEIDIDCGGPCAACAGLLTADIDVLDIAFVSTNIIGESDLLEIKLRALDFNGNVIEIVLPNAGLGLYEMGEFTMNLFYVDQNNLVYRTVTGSLVITKLDLVEGIISGVFSGTLENESGVKVEILNGVFNEIILN